MQMIERENVILPILVKEKVCTDRMMDVSERTPKGGGEWAWEGVLNLTASPHRTKNKVSGDKSLRRLRMGGLSCLGRWPCFFFFFKIVFI